MDKLAICMSTGCEKGFTFSKEERARNVIAHLGLQRVIVHSKRKNLLAQQLATHKHSWTRGCF